MGLEEKLAAAKDLIAKREEIDTKLAELFGGSVPAKAEKRCKKCDQTGHTARTCTSFNAPAETITV